ncbi:DUF502 domain-containing protein [Falsibacillus pallidus]|uniref:Putative membrane protein n=1 Tax=Falsibacillus pallidus TaxID=493781 RepID=A0A370GH13_9BACI|nr:DUF502 domain-containing protein [Falsibacillus pallidus]RDI43085.1 putative membrane protein [Falsibacillus pallidus]
MKSLAKNFLNGVLTVIPIVLVIYVIYKLFVFFDSILGNILRPHFPHYIPGIGLIATLIIITILGWLSTKLVTGTIIKLIDKLLAKIPLVKTIYSVIKDTVNSFLGDKKSFSKVVTFTFPGTAVKSIGFITSENLEQFYSPFENYCAVYIPQTFQVAGFTLLIPKEDLEIIEVKPEEAMKFILSGGMTSK